MNHTKEPWIVGYEDDSDYCLVGPHDGDWIVYHPVVKLHSEDNARRIVACVNACAGIPNEVLEEAGTGTVREMLTETAAKAGEVMRQRGMRVAWNIEPNANGPIEAGISALPGVTLEDLK